MKKFYVKLIFLKFNDCWTSNVWKSLSVTISFEKRATQEAFTNFEKTLSNMKIFLFISLFISLFTIDLTECKLKL